MDKQLVKASEFKAKCLRLIDAVASNGEELVITKHGKPMARLVPYRERPETLSGIDAGILRIVGDIVEPIDADWEVLKDESNRE